MFLKLRTYVCLATALSLVFAIYFFENKVDGLRNEIAEKKNAIQKHREEITMLQAEWSYQNNPERLGELMFRLNWQEVLQTPQAMQFTELTDLPEKAVHFSKVASSNTLR